MDIQDFGHRSGQRIASAMDISYSGRGRSTGGTPEPDPVPRQFPHDRENWPNSPKELLTLAFAAAGFAADARLESEAEDATSPTIEPAARGAGKVAGAAAAPASDAHEWAKYWEWQAKELRKRAVQSVTRADMQVPLAVGTVALPLARRRQ